MLEAILRRQRRALFLASLALVLGVSAGGFIGGNTINFVANVYQWSDGEAVLYLPDSQQSFSEQNAKVMKTVMGANHLRFPLDSWKNPDSYVQRFDPCSCDRGIAVGSIGLASVFLSQEIEIENLSLGGSAAGFTEDQGMAILSLVTGRADPQIFTYFDINSFRSASMVVGATSGLLVGLVLSIGIFALNNAPIGLRRSSGFHPTRWFTALVGLTLIIMTIQMFLGATLVGPTIDEGLHLDHLRSFLAGGQYSNAAYGPVPSLFGHILNVTVGNESPGDPSAEIEAFVVRHLSVSVLATVGIGGAYLSARLLFASRRLGLWAALVLSTIPLWVGHGMFNLKDIPAASGFSLLIAAIVGFMVSPRLRRKNAFLLAMTAVTGLGLSIGTRPGIWPFLLVAAVSGFIGFHFLRTPKIFGNQQTIRNLWKVALIAIVPLALSSWFFGRYLLEAALVSANYPWSKSRRFFGERIMSTPESHEVFRILLSVLPEWTVLLSFAGLITTAVILTTRMRNFGNSRRVGILGLFFVTQLATPFIAIALLRPTLYDGVRQLLFVFPSIAVLSTIGLWGILKFVEGFSRQGNLLIHLALGVLVLPIFLTAADTIRLFPYSYVYLNSVAQGHSASGKWETDYWSASLAEAVLENVAENEPVSCGVTHQPERRETLRSPCISVLPLLESLKAPEKGSLEEHEFWTARSERELLQYGPPPENCHPAADVSRKLRGETLVLSRLYICGSR